MVPFSVQVPGLRERFGQFNVGIMMGLGQGQWVWAWVPHFVPESMLVEGTVTKAGPPIPPMGMNVGMEPPVAKAPPAPPMGSPMGPVTMPPGPPFPPMPPMPPMPEAAAEANTMPVPEEPKATLKPQQPPGPPPGQAHSEQQKLRTFMEHELNLKPTAKTKIQKGPPAKAFLPPCMAPRPMFEKKDPGKTSDVEVIHVEEEPPSVTTTWSRRGMKRHVEESHVEEHCKPREPEEESPPKAVAPKSMPTKKGNAEEKKEKMEDSCQATQGHNSWGAHKTTKTKYEKEETSWDNWRWVGDQEEWSWYEPTSGSRSSSSWW